MSEDLKIALEALAAAKPDPKQVEALAEETLRRRETPYRENEIWQMSVQLNNALVCKLCGSTIHPVANMQVSHSVSARNHLEWHNGVERRLRRLEGTA